MLNAAKVTALVGTVRPEQAKDFYQNVLGLDFVSEDQFALVFAGKNAHVRVSRVPAVAPAPYAVLAFVVDDIAREIDAITTRGATMACFPVFAQDARGIWTAPDGTKVAWFHDPDLNLLSLVQYA